MVVIFSMSCVPAQGFPAGGFPTVRAVKRVCFSCLCGVG